MTETCHTAHTAERVVIVGGGVSGLSIAARLAQAGLPVTLFEASRIGCAASTRNQGWLHSGAWFALHHPELARACHESLQQTLQFSPDCVEPEHDGMLFLASCTGTNMSHWTQAWEQAGIPFQNVPLSKAFERLPDIEQREVRQAFLLPDRAIRTEVLLTDLAASARNAGAELRLETPVDRFLKDGDRLIGVATNSGEEVMARLVIVAAGTRDPSLIPESTGQGAGCQSTYAAVPLKTHLIAVRPEIGRFPYCVVDAGGFNHIPHAQVSVFGFDRWIPVSNPTDQQVVPNEISRLWDYVDRFHPGLDRKDRHIVEWAGTTIQAMHLDKIHPGEAPRPAVIDQSNEPPCIGNLLRVFPGRATLWARLAEDTRRTVLDKLDVRPRNTAKPPWVL